LRCIQIETWAGLHGGLLAANLGASIAFTSEEDVSLERGDASLPPVGFVLGASI
jgi:hypothetical protein